MIEMRTKVVFITDDGAEHSTENDAVFHEYCSLYKATMGTKRGQAYWDEELRMHIIKSPNALANLLIMEPLLLVKLGQVVWLQRNPNCTLKDFEERTKNVT